MNPVSPTKDLVETSAVLLVTQAFDLVRGMDSYFWATSDPSKLSLDHYLPHLRAG